MATRNIVPRATGEGSLGTNAKKWGSAYINEIHGALKGNADTATSATSAASATRATSATTADSATKAAQDGNGNVITSTYVRKSELMANVKAYGAKGDGTTDDTAAIQKCLTENASVYFPPGVYLISKMLTSCQKTDAVAWKVELDANAEIVASTNFTGDWMLTFGNLQAADYGTGTANELSGGKWLATNASGIGGIRVMNVRHAHIHNIAIGNFDTVGLQIDCDSSANGGSSDDYVDHVFAYGRYDKAGTIGILINSMDNNISNIRTYFAQTGIKIAKAGNFLSECHTVFYTSNQDTCQNSIGFHICNGAIDTTLDKCYPDMFATEFYIEKAETARVSLTNCLAIAALCPDYAVKQKWAITNTLIKTTGQYIASIRVDGLHWLSTHTQYTNYGYVGPIMQYVNDNTYYAPSYFRGIVLNVGNLKNKTRDPLIWSPLNVDTAKMYMNADYDLNYVCSTGIYGIQGNCKNAPGFIKDYSAFLLKVESSNSINGYAWFVIHQKIETQGKVFFRDYRSEKDPLSDSPDTWSAWTCIDKSKLPTVATT